MRTIISGAFLVLIGLSGLFVLHSTPGSFLMIAFGTGVIFWGASRRLLNADNQEYADLKPEPAITEDMKKIFEIEELKESLPPDEFEDKLRELLSNILTNISTYRDFDKAVKTVNRIYQKKIISEAEFERLNKELEHMPEIIFIKSEILKKSKPHISPLKTGKLKGIQVENHGSSGLGIICQKI